MISFTSILTAIKGASLASKVGLSIGAVAVVAGGTAGTVAIINASKPHEETPIVADSQNDDNSLSEQDDTQTGEAGEFEDDNSKSEQVADDKKPTTNNSQTTTQKPANSASSSNGQSTNSSSVSKPSTPAAQPSQPSQSSQSSQPSAPSQPSQPAQPAKKPDYNLNDKYVAGSTTYAFYTYDSGAGQCSLAEEKSFFGVARFTGTSNDLWAGSHGSQYVAYANSKGYDTTHCGGMGAAIMSWQDAISRGIALDEAKCTQYGLSCGRW